MRGINGPIEAITAMTVAVNGGGRGGGHVDPAPHLQGTAALPRPDSFPAALIKRGL